MMSEIYIGLMSGTSLDAMDAVAVSFANPTHPDVLATHSLPWSESARQQIQQLCQPSDNEISQLASLDNLIAQASVQAVQAVLQQANLQPSQVAAIGSHGQTVRHYPERRFTLQIGDPNIIAEQCGITVVADFRRRDIAAGGQGAPLVPAFHQAIFSHANKNRVIVNVGGISNISILSSSDQTPFIGFDVGAGNLLMDGWCQQHWQQAYDNNGHYASQAPFSSELLAVLLNEPFFAQAQPKSTGRELFNPAWLTQKLIGFEHLTPLQVQATLCQFTARGIADAILQYAPNTDEVFVCGGGSYNQTLMTMLQQLLEHRSVQSTQAVGIAPQWVEAIAFAWLARQTMLRLPSNAPSVTGASGYRILGGIYPA